MAHQVADLDARLAVGGELRPVPGDRGVEIQLAAVCQKQGGQRRHRLGSRVDVDDGVGLPRPGAGFVGPAAPEIDRGLTVHRGAERRSDVGPVRQVGLELIAYGREPIARETAHRTVGHDRHSLVAGTTVGEPTRRRQGRSKPGPRFR